MLVLLQLLSLYIGAAAAGVSAVFLLLLLQSLMAFVGVILSGTNFVAYYKCARCRSLLLFLLLLSPCWALLLLVLTHLPLLLIGL